MKRAFYETKRKVGKRFLSGNPFPSPQPPPSPPKNPFLRNLPEKLVPSTFSQPKIIGNKF